MVMTTGWGHCCEELDNNLLCEAALAYSLSFALEG